VALVSRERCLIAEHPHPGRACRDPREVYRNRWGNAPAQPPVEPVDGQLALDELVVDEHAGPDEFGRCTCHGLPEPSHLGRTMPS
jgi:hypothetical protein